MSVTSRAPTNTNFFIILYRIRISMGMCEKLIIIFSLSWYASVNENLLPASTRYVANILISLIHLVGGMPRLSLPGQSYKTILISELWYFYLTRNKPTLDTTNRTMFSNCSIPAEGARSHHFDPRRCGPGLQHSGRQRVPSLPGRQRRHLHLPHIAAGRGC